MDELLLFTIDEPFTTLQTDGLPPIIRIDEPFTAYQSEGLLLTILIDELSPQHRWTSSYYLRLTSPSLHFKQTGSFLQFLLTSSPLNTDGRAPTIHSDEPFTALQTYGLLLTILIDKLSPQHRWTSSYYLRLTCPSLHFIQTGPLLLFTWMSSYNSLPDELFLTALSDELLLFTWTSSFNSLPDELPLFTWTSSYNGST